MDLKNKDEALPNLLMILAILTLLGGLGYMLFVPRPTVAGLAAGKARSQRQIEGEIDKAKDSSREAKAAAAPRLWTGSPETITASVLAQLTTEANRRKVQVGAFRPQRVQPLVGITELPFSLQISGAYPAVREFIASLDAASGKIVLRSVQLASADAGSSAVTATLGVSVYKDGVVETATPTKKTGANRG